MTRRPPRLIVRTMAVTFLTVAVILSVVFVVLIVDARERVRASEAEKLQVSEGMFTALEARRQRDQIAIIATLAENPTLKAALDTYVAESQFDGLEPEQQVDLSRTVAREAEKLAVTTAADVLAILDTDARVFASAGSSRERWPIGARVNLHHEGDATFQDVAALPSGAFRVSGATLRLGDRDVGMLVLATSLDTSYARELSALSHAGVAIVVDGVVVASTIPDNVAAALVAAGADTASTLRLEGKEYATRVLVATGSARIYLLTSIDDAARAATWDALVALGTIGCGSMLLAALGSLWLARTLSEPIDRVASAIATTTAHSFRRQLKPTGSSRELDALTEAFNDLMTGLTTAETETRSAYLGAIRALAAALDARDPYTAGHSERVSAVAVLIAREMNLCETDIEIVRLGALLHDIGKIGVPDHVLRKPGRLTRDEFEQIKRHPALGARILRQVPFLAPYLPVVELHHEQPDGNGYPFGLRGNEIPLAAHIVHVADTYDAMTSARAYRPARPGSVALCELRRYSGAQFHPASVDALETALPEVASAMEAELEEGLVGA